MPDYQWIIGPAAGGQDVHLPQPKQRQMTFRLTPPHESTCSIDGRQLARGKLVPLATDLHIIRDQSLFYRGRIGPIRNEGDDKQLKTDLRSADFRELLNRRRLYSDVTHTGVEQAEILWLLINTSQGLTGGQLGITKGIGNPTGQPRDREYLAGGSVGELAQQLSEVQAGFDWDIRPDSASGLKLDVYYPQRGSDKGVVLEFGGLVAKYVQDIDPGAYANAIRVTGDETVTPALTAEIRTAVDLADPVARPEGRWDGVFGHDIQTQPALAERADWQLAESQVAGVSWTLTLKPGGWGGPNHIWLGDTVEVVVQDGHLDVDYPYRVYEVAITLDDDGNETVVIQAGGPKPDFRRRAARTLRRLTELERR